MSNNTTNSSTKLTEDNINNILKAMDENLQESDKLKDIANLPSNNGIEEHKPEQGEKVLAQIEIDSETGERKVKKTIDPKDVGLDPEKSMDEVFENMGVFANDINFDDNFEIQPEDIKRAVKEDSETVGDNFNISDKTTLELINVVNKFRNGGEIRYKDLPEEVRKYIDDTLIKSNGISPTNNSLEAKTARNYVADLLITNYASNISMNKYMDQFNTEMENAFSGINREVSKYIKEYDEDKKGMLEKACKNITDEEKKKKMEQVLDSMYDGYQLNRLKEYRVRIKNIELQKPERVFDYIINKYRDNKYNMYDLCLANNILNRHLVKNNYEPVATKFLIKFSKYCMNYNVENPEQHAFMYFTIYNIVLLDMYNGEEYDNFAPNFLKNIVEVVR